ncbi:hypothetical protein ACH5RR_006702 [Cinchona calisaya]|uniref:Uncharacterized protein n=1 Tax=Cinchona calisaya TaxID=153742 RepID=A0ABD3AQ15_9GENT
MLFSKNTSDVLRSTICNFLNIFEIDDLGKYICYPPKNSKFSTSIVRCILDKVKAKLAGKKYSVITFARRKTIVQQADQTFLHITCRIVFCHFPCVLKLVKLIEGFYGVVMIIIRRLVW